MKAFFIDVSKISVPSQAEQRTENYKFSGAKMSEGHNSAERLGAYRQAFLLFLTKIFTGKGFLK